MSLESKVTEFREAFNLPINSKPTQLSTYDTALHMSLLKEEFKELVVAVNRDDLVETFDALLDICYVAYGMGVHMGLPMEKGMNEVQASNMSKLDDNGEPLYHDGTEGPKGKVKKGPNFWEPRLDILIESELQ